ncbi:alkaline shock response membrane anchor protein AmaP [Hugonella massiliensis]|uniref:alkaline shock response membrane anchor protein AmaP n=1 Tax=Hugonella massiliensis TaxID=1720315 RepID=UPI00073F725B|nr:alkaline shock response membrane anchor protein AmaP [Hugonella massiliensis]
MRKFGMVIYFLAVVLLVGAWAGYWFGIDPVASALDAVGSEAWFNVVLLALVAIVAFGSVLLLLRALCTRSKSSYEESSNEFGSVLVSRDTIEQTAEDVVMQHPEVRSLKTKARLVNRKNPYADITARVAPRGVIPFASVAPVIQSEVKTSVEHLTGNRVRKVVIDVRKNHNPDDLMSSEEEAVMQKRIAAFAAGEARPIDVIPCPVDRKLGAADEAPEEKPAEDEAQTAEEPVEAVAVEEDVADERPADATVESADEVVDAPAVAPVAGRVPPAGRGACASLAPLLPGCSSCGAGRDAALSPLASVAFCSWGGARASRLPARVSLASPLQNRAPHCLRPLRQGGSFDVNMPNSRSSTSAESISFQSEAPFIYI